MGLGDIGNDRLPKRQAGSWGGRSHQHNTASYGIADGTLCICNSVELHVFVPAEATRAATILVDLDLHVGQSRGRINLFFYETTPPLQD